MTFKQRRLNVDASWHIDVEETLYKRHVSADHSQAYLHFMFRYFVGRNTTYILWSDIL